jgi:hypothetical protein
MTGKSRKRLKKYEVVTIATVEHCHQCPHYYYDMEDGDLCIKNIHTHGVNKYGEGIPDWCELDDA